MSRVITDFLQDLPYDLHDNFLKLVEHDFWKFQYACRHFQIRYKESLGIDFSDTEIRNHPYFKQASAYLNSKVKKLKTSNAPIDAILMEIDRYFKAFKRISPDLPDEIVEAVKKNVQTGGKHRPRKALNNQFITNNRMHLLPIQLKKIATEDCDVSHVDFEKMINGQLTSEDWEKNSSIQRFCTAIKRRTRSALARRKLELSLASDVGMTDQERCKTLSFLNWQENACKECISTNRFLLHATDDFGAGYFLHNLFRHADVSDIFPDVSKISPFDAKKYLKVLQSALISDVFWQPVPFKSAVEWICWYITVCGKLEPYIAVTSNTFEPYSLAESINSPIWEGNYEGILTIFVDCFNNSDSTSDLNKKILKIEQEIGYRIDRLMNISSHRRKKELSKNDTTIFADETFKVVLNTTNTNDIKLLKFTFDVWVDFNHPKFELKKVIDSLRVNYFVHTYQRFQSQEYIGLINDDVPIVTNFNSGTVSRLTALYLWDQVKFSNKKLSHAIDGLSKSLPDLMCGDKYHDDYLRSIYATTKKCINENKVIPIS